MLLSLHVDKAAGLIEDIEQLSSPHCDARPEGVQPDLIVVHGITLPPGEFGGPWIDDLFLGRLDPTVHPYFASIAHLRVSAHLLIRREGSVTQYVPFHLRAWHAGPSAFGGRERCNDFSIGIELEGTDEAPYSDAQYASLTEVICALKTAYPSLVAITGHQDIAPGRKTDPGPAFEWGRVARLLEVGGLPVRAEEVCASGARLAIMTA